MKQDMSCNSDDDKVGQLGFVLSQLRDDLEELISGLGQGTMAYDVVVDGAKTQLQWVLNNLNQHSEPPVMRAKSIL